MKDNRRLITVLVLSSFFFFFSNIDKRNRSYSLFKVKYYVEKKILKKVTTKTYTNHKVLFSNFIKM